MTLKRNIKNNKRYNIYIFNTCIIVIIFKLGFTSVSRQTVTRYYNYCSEREFLIHSIILKCMSFNIIISFWGSFSEKMHKIEQPNCRFFWQKVTIERVIFWLRNYILERFQLLTCTMRPICLSPRVFNGDMQYIITISI